MGRAQSRDILRRCTKWGNNIHGNAHLCQKMFDFFNIVSMPKPKRQGANKIDRNLRTARHGFGQGFYDLKERLIGAEVFFALIRRQFQWDHRDRQTHGFSQATGIILNQFRGARGPHNHGLRHKPLIGRAAGIAEDTRGICAQVAPLKCCICDRRAVVAPLNHRE